MVLVLATGTMVELLMHEGSHQMAFLSRRKCIPPSLRVSESAAMSTRNLLSSLAMMAVRLSGRSLFLLSVYSKIQNIIASPDRVVVTPLGAVSQTGVLEAGYV